MFLFPNLANKLKYDQLGFCYPDSFAIFIVLPEKVKNLTFGIVHDIIYKWNYISSLYNKRVQ